jgi:hypothetical protein
MSKDRRSVAERREYMRAYHIARKAGQPPPGGMPVKPKPTTRKPTSNPSFDAVNLLRLTPKSCRTRLIYI